MKIKDFIETTNDKINNITVRVKNTDLELPGNIVNFGFLGIPIDDNGKEWVRIFDLDISTFKIENGGFSINAIAPEKKTSEKVMEFLSDNEKRIKKILDHYGAKNEPVPMKELDMLDTDKTETPTVSLNKCIEKFEARQAKKELKEKFETPYNSKISKQRPRWTDAEIAIAKDVSLSSEEVAQRLGRTIQSVKMFRHNNGINVGGRTSFSKEDVAVMKDRNLSNVEAAAKLGKPVTSIANWRYKHGLTNKRVIHGWSDEEIALARDENLSNKEIAQRTGRTTKSVQKYRENNGIKPKDTKRPFSDEEKELMRDVSISAMEIAEAYGRTIGSVNAWRYRNGCTAKAK